MFMPNMQEVVQSHMTAIVPDARRFGVATILWINHHKTPGTKATYAVCRQFATFGEDGAKRTRADVCLEFNILAC